MAMISVDERVPGGMRHRFQASTRVKVARWLLDEGIYPVIQDDPRSTVMVSGRGWMVSSFGVNRFVERMLPEVLDSKRERFVQQLVKTFATHGERSDQVPRVDVWWEQVALQEAAADWPRAWRGGRRASPPAAPVSPGQAPAIPPVVRRRSVV